MFELMVSISAALFHFKGLNAVSNSSVVKSGSLMVSIYLYTNKTRFIFDNSLYRQIDGAAVESPLGATVENPFLCHYEKEWLDICPIEFNPKLYKKYVDDIFVMFQSRESCQKVC